MAQFTRRTILAATDMLTNLTHAQINRFSLERGLENVVTGYSKEDRANTLAKYLIQNPELLNEDGENLLDSIVTTLVNRAIELSNTSYPRRYSFKAFTEAFPHLNRGLERDGFTVEDGTLRRTLPESLDLPKADDEVHRFAVSKGHLDQGISAHARGDWAAANSQFRTYIESLCDEVAARLHQNQKLPPAGHERRQWLANRTPPFFLANLNEWTGDG